MTRLVRTTRYAGVLVLVVVVWWLTALAFESRGGVVPGPGAVFSRLFADGWDFYGRNLLATLGEAAQGFVWGNGLAILLGALTAFFPVIRPFVSQLALFAYSVPIVAIGPILVTALHGRTPMVVLSAAAVLFITLNNVIDGLSMSDKGTLSIVDSLGGSKGQKLRFVRWWYALPNLFSGLKLAVPGALMGAIFGEYLGRVDNGLGVVLVRAQKELEIDRAWGIIVVMVLVSSIGYAIVAWIGKRLLRWAADITPVQSSPDQRIWVNVFGIIGSAIVLVAIWWVGIGLADMNPVIGKSPLDVAGYLFSSDPTGRAEVFHNLWITLGDAGGGFVVGIVLAILCALLATRVSWFADLIMPIAMILRAAPLVAIAPIMFIAIGRSYTAVTVIVAIIVFFPAFLIMLEGMATAPKALLGIVDSLGGKSGAQARFVVLPASVPYLFSALRVTLPNAIMGALMAEWLATGTGLGAAFIQDVTKFNFAGLWSGVVFATAASVILYALVDFIEIAYRRSRRLV